MVGVVLLVLVGFLLVTKKHSAGGDGSERVAPRAVDRVVARAVLAGVAHGVPEPVGHLSGSGESFVVRLGRRYVQAEAALQRDGVGAAARAGIGQRGVRGHL